VIVRLAFLELTAAAWHAEAKRAVAMGSSIEGRIVEDLIDAYSTRDDLNFISLDIKLHLWQTEVQPKI